ncbi:hypothetical protein ABMC89_14420 [Sulfitobacter sp. HNIBRBA3233]|uniref:hypothetical protein n=1 Tax=Sulfitobacter marinivivus TaxID=3158558 RepID=UPI0032DED321
MKRLAMVLTLAAVAACGVDGEPVQPAGGATVTLSNAGASVGGTVGLRRGPLTLGLGF